MKQKNADHQEAQEVKKHLEPRVNKSVPTMYETMKTTFSDITNRRKVVRTDKESIEEVRLCCCSVCCLRPSTTAGFLAVLRRAVSCVRTLSCT